MNKSILTMAIASILTVQVSAETSDIPILPTVEIQTTQADRAETVMVITRDDTEGEHFTNINDSLFSGIPGVSTSRRSETGFGGPNSGFLIRGMQGPHVPVFVDGIPIQVNNHFHARVDRYSSDMIDSMEITRGASVLKHGASAVAGAIDIYTRTPGNGTSGFIQASKGTYNSTEVFGDVGVGSENGSLLFSFSDRLTDGPPVEGEAFAAEAHDLTNLNVKLTKIISPNLSVGFRASNAKEIPEHFPFADGVTYRRFGQNETDKVFNLDHKTENTNTLIALHDNVMANYSGCYTNGAFDDTKAVLYGSCVDGGGTVGTVSRKTEKERGLLIKHTMLRGSGNDTTFGLHKVKYYKSGVYGNEQDNTSFVSGYVQANQNLDDNTRITGGARVTLSDDFDTNISPEIGIIKRLGSSRTLRARAGKAFRVPRLGDNDINEDPTIEPEDFNHVEIGLNKVFADGGEFDIAVWAMKGKNLIETIDDGINNKYQANSGEFSNKGIEALLTRPITANLSAYAAVTLSSLETQSAAPQTMYDLGVEYRKDQVRANLSLRDASRNSKAELSDNDYRVLDGRFQYMVSKDMTVFVDVDNITNTSYVTFNGYGSDWVNVGRMVSIGLRHSF